MCLQMFPQDNEMDLNEEILRMNAMSSTRAQQRCKLNLFIASEAATLPHIILYANETQSLETMTQ